MNDGDASSIILILFGAFVWDYVTSLWFEFRLLTKKIRFRWQFVPYFLARYFVLTHIMLDVVVYFIGVDVLPLCTRASLTDLGIFLAFLTIVFSTWNLLTRTIIVWGHHPLVMKPLLAVGSLHFVLSLVVIFVGRSSCVTQIPSVWSVMIFGIITLVIEFAILVLSLVGIRRASQYGESHLARLLKAQGIIYFVMVFFLHMSTIITTSIQSDAVVDACVGVICATLAPMLSCRLVTSTLSQNCHADFDSEERMPRTERFELSEDPRSQNSSSGPITTCIEVSKDRSATPSEVFHDLPQ